MYDAMKVGDYATARDRALALRRWLNQGGFSPPNTSETEVRGYLANVLRRTAGWSSADDEIEPS